jgi:hypothetical protein
MAENQGGASISVRGEAIVLVAASESMGWQTEAGYWRGLTITDWDAFCRRASVADPDDELGALLRQCLHRSRLMPVEWGRAQLRDADSQFNHRLAIAFGLGSTHRLYPGMKDVGVDWSGPDITFVPTRNKGGGVFEGLGRGDSGHEELIIAFESSDHELGATLKQAIVRSR